MTRDSRRNSVRHRVTLRQLEALLLTAECGSMGKAAERLASSQPVITKAIADLEHALGVRLLDRGPRGAEPTLYGRALLKRGVAIFDELEQGVREVEFLTDQAAGELHVGCADSMMSGLLPVIINRLCKRHPRMTFHLTQAPSGEALNRELRDRKVDLILGKVGLPMTETDLNYQVLFDERQLVVTGPKSPWLRRRRIRLADLGEERWVLPPPNTGGGGQIAEIFRSCGVEVPHAAVFSTSIQLYESLTTSGNFLAMLPASVLWFGPKRTSLTILPVKLPAAPWPIGITTIKGRTVSSATQLFVEAAREIASSRASV
jgi:DNA-binding transcriptional LysR family regulator